MVDGLRQSMAENGIDWFIVFSQDEHLSEYTAPCDKYREALSGFTGSAGTLLVGEGDCYLWTDSRYFIQAEKELSGSGITLMKYGFPKVPSLEDFLARHIWDGQNIALDPKTVSYAFYEKLSQRLPDDVSIIDGGRILKKSADVPKRVFNGIKAVPEDFCKSTVTDKLRDLRSRIQKRYASSKSYTYLLSDLTSVMWLFNLRGSDIEHVPVAYSYAAITAYSATLYVSRKSLEKEAISCLEDAGVVIKEYSLFYSDLDDIATDIVIADKRCNNAGIIKRFDGDGTLAFCNDTYLIPKSVKNSTEINGMISAHLQDAVSMIRFIKYVKESASKSDHDEYSLGAYLDGLRLEGGCVSTSFDTICAYGANSAVVHYCAKEGSASKVKPEGFLLVDSGGQYEFRGTTDITRTIALGEVTDEEKKVYTTVLIGNLRLMDMTFPSGYRGALLDLAAESPLWEGGYYCGHGIGHGVGCYLSVHESDVRIGRSSEEWEAPIVSGIIVSDEPGIYLEGKFGVRLENLLLCVRAEDIDGVRMCRFEPLSLVPFDKDAIDMSLLTGHERDILSRYNDLIWEKISPLLNEDERNWLKEIIDIN